MPYEILRQLIEEGNVLSAWEGDDAEGRRRYWGYRENVGEFLNQTLTEPTLRFNAVGQLGRNGIGFREKHAVTGNWRKDAGVMAHVLGRVSDDAKTKSYSFTPKVQAAASVSQVVMGNISNSQIQVGTSGSSQTMMGISTGSEAKRMTTEGKTKIEFELTDEGHRLVAEGLESGHARDVLKDHAALKTPTGSAAGSIKSEHVAPVATALSQGSVSAQKVESQGKGRDVGFLRSLIHACIEEVKKAPVQIFVKVIGTVLGTAVVVYLCRFGLQHYLVK